LLKHASSNRKGLPGFDEQVQVVISLEIWLYPSFGYELTMGKETRGSSNKAKYYGAAITAIHLFFSLVLRPLDAYTAADILFYRVFSCAVLMLLIVFLFRRNNGQRQFNYSKVCHRIKSA
jgi:hypothetical protein